MAHHFQPPTLCNNTFNNFCSSDHHPMSSCTSPFSWPYDDAKSSSSSHHSPASVSNIDITSYSSDPLLDFTLLSPTMCWNQPFLISDQTAENNFHGLVSAESNQIQSDFMLSSSLDSGLIQDDHSSMGFFSSEQLLNGLVEPSYEKVRGTFHDNNIQQQNCEKNYSNNFQSQGVMERVQELMKASGPKQNFWNPLANTAACLNMINSMPNQSAQSDHSSISTNLSVKSKFGVNNSDLTSNKRTESEPVLKKPRIQTPSPLPTFKVRKEKLGDRVTALQQLVSPFGKTDTASVLHEAIDYIKFLHDQVRTLSTPYLKNDQQMQHGKIADKHKDSKGDTQELRSRGLCLVPISSTYPVTTETSIDFWNPTFGASYM